LHAAQTLLALQSLAAVPALRSNAKETAGFASKSAQESSSEIRTARRHTACLTTLIASTTANEGRTMHASTALDRDELIRLADDGCPHGGDTDLWPDLGESD
jgi:hypothetical protein